MTTEPSPSIGAITLFVADVAASKAWYQRVFDVPLVFEDDSSAVVRFGSTMVNLLTVREAPDLIAPATVAAPAAGAALQFTIWVDDADASVAVMRSRGARLVNGPIDRVWGQRTALFADPDGHLWEIAQTIS